MAFFAPSRRRRIRSLDGSVESMAASSLVATPVMCYCAFPVLALAALFVIDAVWSHRVQAAPITSAQILAGAAEAPEAANSDEMQDARTKFDARDYSGALESLKLVAEKYPELPPARSMLGRMFMVQQDYVNARRMLEQATIETPNDADAYLLLGSHAMDEGRALEAKLLFERGNELTQAFEGNDKRKLNYEIRCLAGLAEVEERRGNWEDARPFLEKWADLDAKSGAAHLRLGRCLFGLEQYDDAYDHLKTASALSEDFALAETSMASMFAQLNKLDEANAWMQRAIDAAPDDPRTRLDAGRFFLERNKPSEAIVHVAKALELDPDNVDAMLLRGIIARYNGKYDEAAKYLERAYLERPGDADAANQLALSLIENDGDTARRRAVTLAELNMRQFPRNPDVIATLGWVYYKERRLNEAARVLSALSNLRTLPNADALYYMAKVNNDLGNAEEAGKLLEAALKAKGYFANRKDAEEWSNTLLAKPE